jgi:prepilin-type processing-associated H-X9-DG protein
MNHESAIKTLPSDGWAGYWLGHPDRGAGTRQPGGWIFNILPYIEQGQLYGLAAGKTDSTNAKLSATTLAQTPITAFYCPSRRQAKALPTNTADTGLNAYGNTTYYVSETGGTNWMTPVLTSVAKCDYAANGGDMYLSLSNVNSKAAPEGLALGYSVATIGTTAGVDGLLGTTTGKNVIAFAAKTASGSMFLLSTVSISNISDGSSNTILAAEKYLMPDYYETVDFVNGSNLDAGDDAAAYCGDCDDVRRWVLGPNVPVINGVTGVGANATPARDTTGYLMHLGFGSAHAGGFNAVFCDGSVRQVSYGIDSAVYENLGNRKDGNAIDVTAMQF